MTLVNHDVISSSKIALPVWNFSLAFKRQVNNPVNFQVNRPCRSVFIRKRQKWSHVKKLMTSFFQQKRFLLFCLFAQSFCCQTKLQCQFLWDSDNWNPVFQLWPIFALLGLTAVKIATIRGPRCARSNYFLRLMYVWRPNIGIYEVSRR